MVFPNAEQQAFTADNDIPDLQPRFDARDPLVRFAQDKLGLSWLHFFFLALFIYGPFEKLIISALGGYLDLSGDPRTWNPPLVDFFTGFIAFPIFFAFYGRSGDGINHTFVSLWRHKSFANTERYTAMLQRMQISFDSNRLTAFSMLFALVVVLLVHLVLWGPTSAVPPWFGVENNLHRLLSFAMIGLVGYAAGQILARQVLAISWLRRLFKEMGDDLVIHPYHIDEAGGLGAIGEQAMRLSYLLLVVMVYLVASSVFPSFREGGQLSIRLWNPLIVLAWALYLVIVPLSFVFLLWLPHRAMKHVRDSQLSQVSARLDALLSTAKESTISDQGRLPDILKEIEHLKAMRNLILHDFPTWPISSSIRRQVRISSALPFGHFLVTVALDLLQP